MRSAYDDSRLRMQCAGQIGNTWCRHRPKQVNIHTSSNQTSLKRRFKQIARDTGIFADKHLTPGLLAQDPACGPSELQHETRGNMPLSDTAANTVCTKILPIHYFHL